PLAYLLFVVLVSGLAISNAAFFLDRFRVPLLTAILAWFVIATIVGETDHEFDALPSALTPPLEASDVIARADSFYGDPTAPVIVVAAGGGGVRQAVWTTQVLAGLTKRWGSNFSKRVRLISAVSGGSMGM